MLRGTKNFKNPTVLIPLKYKSVILFVIENNTSESVEMRTCGLSNVNVELLE
jgi:hypothetical protein